MQGAEPSYEPARPSFARLLGRLGPDVALVLVFLAALAALISSYGVSLRWSEGPIVIAGSIGLGLIAVLFVARLPSLLRDGAREWPAFATSAGEIARDWGPFVVLMWAFESLETYTGLIGRASIDDALYRFDLRLFGVEPTVWIGRFQTPLLTDWMAFAYGSYFVMPMILATALSLRGRRADFREMSTALVLQMGIAFAIFLVFPAGPPRFYGPLLDGVFQPPQLHSFFGLFEYQQGAFDVADPVRTRSAFPSLHCSLALLTVLYAFRFGDAVLPSRPKLYFWVCLPIVVSLWISVVYLRHHWIADCLVGFVLGGAAQWLAAWLRRVWPKAEVVARA